MKLITKEIRKALPPLYSQDGKGDQGRAMSVTNQPTRRYRTMTKKDFELIAETIREVDTVVDQREIYAHAFADALAETNPRFKRDEFLIACQPNPRPTEWLAAQRSSAPSLSTAS